MRNGYFIWVFMIGFGYQLDWIDIILENLLFILVVFEDIEYFFFVIKEVQV